MPLQPPPERLELRRLAPLFASYLVFGAYWGVWVVVFADFLVDRRMTEGQAGFQLAALSVASIVTMTLVSPRLQRLHLTVTIPLGLVTMGLGAALMAGTPRALLTLPFVVLGIGNGLLDVFVNVGGQMAETRHRRPVLQFLHASYNVGGIVGALGAGLAVTTGAPFRTALFGVAAAFGAVAIWCASSAWMRAQPGPEAAETKVSVSVFRRSPALILPAIVVLSAFMVEGSMDIWSVIYVRETLQASAIAGAVAFALFSLAMAVGRLFAGRILFGLGYRRTIRVSGIGSLVAGLAAALTSSTVVAGVAFLFLGFFISAAAPAAFGMISETDEDPALAIAAMTTVGYTGFVVGPPIMGWLAQTAGMRATMLVLVSVTIGVFLGGVLGPKRERQPRLR
jgi:MFS family permease